MHLLHRLHEELEHLQPEHFERRKKQKQNRTKIQFAVTHWGTEQETDRISLENHCAIQHVHERDYISSQPFLTTGHQTLINVDITWGISAHSYTVIKQMQNACLEVQPMKSLMEVYCCESAQPHGSSYIQFTWYIVIEKSLTALTFTKLLCRDYNSPHSWETKLVMRIRISLY